MDPEFARILKKLAKEFVHQTTDHLFSDKTPPKKRRRESKGGKK